MSQWEPSEEEGWHFDPDVLRDAITPQTKLIVVNFPHNPTGALPSKAVFDEIVAIAAAHRVGLFSDEMYRYLEYRVEDRLPAAVEVYENAITLFGMSKTFGLAGLRIGWVVTRNNALLQRMAVLKDYTTICSSAPSEILALIGLRAKESIIAQNLGKVARNRRVLETFLADHPDTFAWVPPQAGTVCFPKLVRAVSATQFCQDVVKTAGLMLLPSSVYGYDDQHLRIGLGRENLPEALGVLDDWLQGDGR